MTPGDIPAQHMDRIAAMLAPDQRTWDLSPNDVESLRWLRGECDRLRDALTVVHNVYRVGPIASGDPFGHKIAAFVASVLAAPPDGGGT